MDSVSWAIALSQPGTVSPTTQKLHIPRSDRWLIYYRLQELAVICWCFEDGSLHVEINNGITLLLVHSVLQQFAASRQELVDWLERCFRLKA